MQRKDWLSLLLFKLTIFIRMFNFQDEPLRDIQYKRTYLYYLGHSIFLIFTCFSKGLQRDLKPISINLLDKKFIVIYIITIFYTTGSALLPYSIGMWNVSLFKDPILWIIFASLPMMYQLAELKT